MILKDEMLFVMLGLGFALGVILYCILMIFIFLISADFVLSMLITSRCAVYKLINDPEDCLDSTNNVWLAIFSPFHKLRRRHDERFCTIKEKLTLIGFAVAKIVLFLPSIIYGTVYIMPGNFRRWFF